MRNANPEHETTPDVTDALKSWQAPRVPTSLDNRVLASYRQQLTRVPWWRRFFSTSIAVPLPLIVVQAVLLVIATAALILFFEERQHSAVALAEPQRPAEVIPIPVVSETRLARTEPAKKPSHPRAPQTRATVVALPVSTVIAPMLATVGNELRESPQPTSVAMPESFTSVTHAPEQRLRFTPALHFKGKVPEPLKVELPTLAMDAFILETTMEKVSFFENRISRPLSRASNWVMTKPLEKGAGLYRALPRTLPTLNSFIAPAKDACLTPFRSNAPVNVQIN